MADLKITGLIVLAAYLLLHHRHYRRHRRHGFGIWYSLRGPWGTNITVRKRF
jgi:hypothetical protein